MEDLNIFISALGSSISTGDILGVLMSIVGIGMSFVLMWLGVKLILGLFLDAIEYGNPLGGVFRSVSSTYKNTFHKGKKGHATVYRNGKLIKEYDYYY